MPEPICSSRSEKPFTDPNDYFGKCDAPPKEPSRPSALASKEPSDPSRASLPLGTQALVDKFKPAAPALPATNNNSQRALAQPAEPFHAGAGKTSSGDSIYASAALLKCTEDGADVEVLGGSAQTGEQIEIALTMGHVGVPAGPRDRLSVDAFTFKGNGGVHNTDGSDGKNIGLQSTFVQVEVAHDFDEGPIMRSGESISIAYSLGAGFEASVGKRDADGDGVEESCARLSVGNTTINACLEPRRMPW